MQQQEASIQTLRDIRSMMEKSARFISLSGWSGVWAGSVALLGSLVAANWINSANAEDLNSNQGRFLGLSIVVFVCAFAGAYYFTKKKAKTTGNNIWNAVSKRMSLQIAIPMGVGTIFVLKFLSSGLVEYIVPASMAFYGLALINGSKYTFSDIMYLGLCISALGCLALFIPQYGLILWAFGFGVLHILYGLLVWNKYERKDIRQEA